MPINLQSKLRTIFLTPTPDSILTDSTLADDYAYSKDYWIEYMHSKNNANLYGRNW